jgi:NADH:ubiquinone oxidoreductase subunit E
LRRISMKLHKPYSEVAGVVGFYSYFSTIAKGKHTVRVCLGTACYVRGGKDVLKSLMDHLKINVGETTEDRTFSLEVGRCFGACGLAPVIMIDDVVHQRVKPSKISELLKPYTTE